MLRIAGSLAGSAPTGDLQIGKVGLPKLVGRRGLVFELTGGRLHDDEGRAGDLSLTSEIRGLFGPARSPTARYVALIPHSPFINASGETLTKF
jgi:hypothetical protein